MIAFFYIPKDILLNHGDGVHKEGREPMVRLADVLALIQDCGIGHEGCCNDCDNDNYYLSIVNEERARLRAALGAE